MTEKSPYSSGEYDSPSIWRQRLRKSLGVFGIAATAATVGYGGGILATSAFPSEVAIGEAYQAEVSLSASPADISHIELMTTGGTVDIAFDSPVPFAPGIKVTPMLSDKSIELAGQENFSALSFVPTDDAIEHALSSVEEQLAIRFSIGVVSAEALLIAGASLYRRDKPRGRHVARCALAGIVALGTVTGQMVLHYQPDNYTTFTADGLLARLYENRTLFTDIEARSQQMQPFITSLLTLSNELQQQLISPEADTPIAARFLLVSDIHGVNQYAMMKRIIDEQHITGVIDSGDLINFGRSEEIDMSDLATGIESLGVPYLFTDGNHDSSSPAATDVLERLSRIPNVILLQSSDNAYTEVTVNGVTIAGFNDPRYYGDSDTENDQRQKPTVSLFNDTFADRPTPDIVVAHEPYATDDIDKAGITINGHTHQADLDGNHIQVGSFTAGGLFHHVPNDENGVSNDQPYAFDILTFDSTCTPESLSRFSFQSIVEGLPQYDSVSYINGNRLGYTPDDRECEPEDGISSVTIPVVATDN